MFSAPTTYVGGGGGREEGERPEAEPGLPGHVPGGDALCGRPPPHHRRLLPARLRHPAGGDGVQDQCLPVSRSADQ